MPEGKQRIVVSWIDPTWILSNPNGTLQRILVTIVIASTIPSPFPSIGHEFSCPFHGDSLSGYIRTDLKVSGASCIIFSFRMVIISCYHYTERSDSSRRSPGLHILPGTHGPPFSSIKVCIIARVSEWQMQYFNNIEHFCTIWSLNCAKLTIQCEERSRQRGSDEYAGRLSIDTWSGAK